MRDILDMLNLIKAEIEIRQIPELIKTFDMRDEVIVEIELGQVRRDVGGKFDARDSVLAET